MALYMSLGYAINNLVSINPELANSLLANFAKFIITYKLINMDTALIVNTYLFATRKINWWSLSSDTLLSKLRSDYTLVAKHPNICIQLQWLEQIVLPVIAIGLIKISSNSNKLVPLI